jgi:hypothetical protein
MQASTDSGSDHPLVTARPHDGESLVSAGSLDPAHGPRRERAVARRLAVALGRTPLRQPQIPAQELLPSTEPVSMIGANPPVHLPAPVTSSDCGLRCGSRIVIGRMTMHATSERGHKERHGRLTVGHDAITAIMTSRSSLRSPPS